MCVRSSSGYSRGGKGNMFGTDGPTASSGSAKGENSDCRRISKWANVEK